MSSARLHIIYGIPNSYRLERALEELDLGHGEIADWCDERGITSGRDLKERIIDEEELFETAYHGNAPWTPAWCGVKLATIDEGEYTSLSSFNILPTDKQKIEAEERISQLPADIRELCPPPGVYIVWATS